MKFLPSYIPTGLCLSQTYQDKRCKINLPSLPHKIKALISRENKRAIRNNSDFKLEMLGSIVSRLGSVNPQYVYSLCQFIFLFAILI